MKIRVSSAVLFTGAGMKINSYSHRYVESNSKVKDRVGNILSRLPAGRALRFAHFVIASNFLRAWK